MTKSCPIESCDQCVFIEERNDKDDFVVYYCSKHDWYLSDFPIIPKDCKLPKFVAVIFEG